MNPQSPTTHSKGRKHTLIAIGVTAALSFGITWGITQTSSPDLTHEVPNPVSTTIDGSARSENPVPPTATPSAPSSPSPEPRPVSPNPAEPSPPARYEVDTSLGLQGILDHLDEIGGLFDWGGNPIDRSDTEQRLQELGVN